MTETPPTFGDDMSCVELRKACEKYAKWAVEAHSIFDDVDLDAVKFQVSRKLKKTAGKAGETRADSHPHFMRFAYGAYQEWGWGDQMKSTIRHELIHIVQYQTRGDAGHGYNFRRMADEVDCEVHCPQFTEYNYGIYCKKCDEMVTGRFRESKMVQKPHLYQSNCCSARCYSEKI